MYIFAFFVEKPAPLRSPKSTLSDWAQGEDVIKKKITPISAFIAKLCPIFEICDDL